MANKIVRIEQKMSGTGTIHDLASDLCERRIEFRRGAKYAVVLAAYYGSGGNGIYYLCRDDGAAISQSKRQREYSHTIVGDDGNYYEVNYGSYYPSLRRLT